MKTRRYRRALVDLSILFVASTFLRGYLSLTFGILSAIILSFISANEKLYNRNFILKNKKYLFIKCILYISYVFVIWFSYNCGYINILYGLWVGIIYTITFVYINDKMLKKESVSK